MFGMKATVSAKGQVTIPKALRDRLGIRPGQKLEFSEGDGVLIARKVTGDDGIVDPHGTLELDRGTDEIMAELRWPDPA